MPLDYLHVRRRPGRLRRNPRACARRIRWRTGRPTSSAAFSHCSRRNPVKLPYGFNLLLLSAVPMNVGIGSSAAVEIGTLSCLNAYLGLKISPSRIARLGQMAENHVVGAPCGIMDQIAITSGRQGCLTHILCRPGEVKGEVQIPPGTGFVGINSMVRHSVAGSPYSDTRIGAFMGKKIINDIRARTGRGGAGLSHGTFDDGTPAAIRRRNSRTDSRLGISETAQNPRRSGHENFAGRDLSRRRPDAASGRGKRARAEIHGRPARGEKRRRESARSSPASACMARTKVTATTAGSRPRRWIFWWIAVRQRGAESRALRRENHRRRHRRHGGRVRQNGRAEKTHSRNRRRISAPRRRDAGHFRGHVARRDGIWRETLRLRRERVEAV